MSSQSIATLCGRREAASLLAATALAGSAGLAHAQSPVYAYVVPQVADPLLANLTPPSNAASQGAWSNAVAWPLVGLHASVLPDGRVINFGTPVGQGVQDGRTIDFWTPSAGVGSDSHVQIANAQNVDSFCAAGALLPSGSMIIAGGGSNASGYSAYGATLINPASSSVSRGANLTAQRWYGTMTELADGRMLMTGGSAPYAVVDAEANPSQYAASISSTPEVYSPSTGWTSLMGAYSTDAFGATNNRAWYPRQWQAPNGSVFGISTDKMWWLNPAGNGSIQTIGDFKTTVNANTLPNVGPTSTAVMYDIGKILQVGGDGYYNGDNTPSSPYATIIDINGASPVLNETSPMTYPRQWANSTVLPTGQVLVTGGSTYADNAGSNAVYPAEIWSPQTGKWTTEASAAYYRGYHSVAALLPDGVILSMGGGVPGPQTNFNAEFYYPPYLFATSGSASVLAKRPKLISLSSNSVDYAGNINIQTDSTTKVAQVSLIALPSVTHSFNMSQRRIPLAFTTNANGVSATLPANANLAPPGYYYLSVVNTSGVPSASAIVALHAAAPPAPAGAPAAAAMPTSGTQVGVQASKISVGSDGTLATVNTSNQLWVSYLGQGWNQIQGTFTDIAVLSASRMYAIGPDKGVYRYDGQSWSQIGVTASAISVSSDGTLAVVNADDHHVWQMNTNAAQPQWTQIGGGVLANRIAVMSAQSMYFVGTDGNVWRTDLAGTTRMVGVNASDIAASSDGAVTVVSTTAGIVGSMWRKPTDDYQGNWSRLPGTAVRVAADNAQTWITTDANGNIYLW